MIKTERLSIRRVKAEDWKAIQAIWADEAKSAYSQYDKPNDPNDRAVRDRIAKWASFADSNDHLFFAVCLGETVIGYVAFNKRSDSREIGYCFHSAFHGQGYAREACSALINMMRRQGVRRITAGTALLNTPSVNLLCSLGFKLVAAEKVSFYNDENGNAIVFDGGRYELPLC